MPSVEDLMKTFSNSGSSSLDTWNFGRRGGDDASTAADTKPVRYVRDGQYDPEYLYHDYANEVEHRPQHADGSKGVFSHSVTDSKISGNKNERQNRTRSVSDQTARQTSIEIVAATTSDQEYDDSETITEGNIETYDSRHDEETRDERDICRDESLLTLWSSSDDEESSTTSTEFQKVLETVKQQNGVEDESLTTSTEFEEVLEAVKQQNSVEDEVQEIPDGDETPSTPANSDGKAGDPNTTKNLCLHELFGEAVSTDDIAWRNALYMLSLQPSLATVSDNGWTPLHVACLGGGSTPPPEFIVRALLYCNVDSARAPDDGGRLPLHILAASSADTCIMQILLQEFPQAVYHTDLHGMTPLHMMLRNEYVELTVERIRLLLGQTVASRVNSATKRRISMRRGQHLDLQVEDLNSRSKSREVTGNLGPLESNSTHFRKYPKDVQECFRRLAQWKRKQGRLSHAVADDTNQDEVSETETNPAAIAALQNLQLPLHIAVRRTTMNTWIDLAEEEGQPLSQLVRHSSGDALRVLVSAFPGALIARDVLGRTPLLTALLNKDCLPSQELVELLLGRCTSGYESLPPWAHDIPLHGKTVDGRYSNPAMIPSLDSHRLPLHVAAEEMASHASIISVIHDSYPGAVNVQDIRGRTPLHLALRSYQSLQPDPYIMSLLLTDRTCRVPDDDGMLPYDLLVEGAQNLPPVEPRASWENNHESQSYDTAKVYRKLFVPSMERLNREKNRWESQQFIKRLRRLPPWLRRHAYSSIYVQELLTEELAGVASCAMIMFNGLVLAALIIIFRLQLDFFTERVSLDGSPVRTWHTAIICVLSLYLLLFQVFRWYTSSSLSVLWHQCIFNLWSWVDLGAVLLSIATTICINGGSTSNDRIGALGTAATGFLWGNVLGYFTTWWYAMAVFMGGVCKIASLLLWPLVAITILTVAFAQMFYTLNLTASNDGCTESVGGRALCTVRDSYVTVYLLFLGTPLVDTENDAEDNLSAGMVVLIVTFAIALMVIVLNVLVLIVVETTRLDSTEVALEAYWGRALTFLFMTWDLTSCFVSSRRKHDAHFVPPRDSASWQKRGLVRNQSFAEKKRTPSENGWDYVVLTITGADKHRSNLWYWGCWGTSDSHIATLALRSFSIFVLIAWTTAGLITFGILWPPQLRRRMFRTLRLRTRSNSRLEKPSSQISDMRSELFQLKVMSYQKMNDVQRDVREIKELLFTVSE